MTSTSDAREGSARPDSQPRRMSKSAPYVMVIILTIATVVTGYYALQHPGQLLAAGLGGVVRFFIAALSGSAVACLLFGVLRSRAQMAGRIAGLTIKATGPFAGAITFTLLAFTLPSKYESPVPPLTDVIVEVHGLDRVNSLIGSITVRFYVGKRTEILYFSPNIGIAQVNGLSPLDLHEGVRIEVESDKYEGVSDSNVYTVPPGGRILLELRRKRESKIRQASPVHTPGAPARISGVEEKDHLISHDLFSNEAHQADEYFRWKMDVDKMDEASLSGDAEEAFLRGGYEWAIAFVQRAKSVQSIGVWQSGYPMLYGAQLALGRVAEASRTRWDMLEAITTAVNSRQGYLSKSTPIECLLRNLGLVREAFSQDPARQEELDGLINQVEAQTTSRLRSPSP